MKHRVPEGKIDREEQGHYIVEHTDMESKMGEASE